ncbi:hypothetical protein [Streptomyces glomeratus]|uniref:Uncharacterized protein n=1 Tax=Streptomyces glomeratus TaxID=284452 RepID=A0ABP6L6V1_9ACTN|nr:hypothetical protein [Streptomyces glomeratus]MCF1509558.1 hypothetical protein [Streptomyces glomeratus]
MTLALLLLLLGVLRYLGVGRERIDRWSAAVRRRVGRRRPDAEGEVPES